MWFYNNISYDELFFLYMEFCQLHYVVQLHQFNRQFNKFSFIENSYNDRNLCYVSLPSYTDLY